MRGVTHAAGRSFGIHGFGRLGRDVARLGQAFGMQVVIRASEASRARVRGGLDGRRQPPRAP